MGTIVKRTLGAVLLLLAAVPPAVHAGSDLDVFIPGLSVQPNVMIMFDNSGSMADPVPYDPAVEYSGSSTPTVWYRRCRTFRSDCTCSRTQTSWVTFTSGTCFPPVDFDNDGSDDRSPSYVKLGNRRNYDAAADVPKLTIAKSVIDGLLQSEVAAQVRWGLYTLNRTVTFGGSCTTNLSSYHSDVTNLRAPIGTDASSLRTTVAGLTANSYTPLAPRLINIGRYFKNDGYHTGASDPVEYECQRNFVVFMTDGLPTAEGDNYKANDAGQFDYIENWFGGPAAADYDGDGVDPDLAHVSPPAGCTAVSYPYCSDTPQYGDGEQPCEYGQGGSDYLDDVSGRLKTDDLRTDLPGQQSLVTYTIGFTVANTLLERAAADGGGQYYTANTADELADAFRQALNAIVGETESFVAPVVPVSQTTRTQSGDRLYIALFRPRDGTSRWPGNLKKYRVADDGQLLDASGNAATDATGDILDGARSYWDGAAASGATVTKGGVGELLKNRTSERAIYTNLSGADLTATGNLFTTGNSAITTAMLGVADSTERIELIDYIRGKDTFDDDEDDNFAENRDWMMGDIIHSVPLVVKYGTGDDDALVILGGNDGLLHAFDDETGEEVWAFVPDVLLGRLKELRPVGGSGTHPYFVDSSARLRTKSDGTKIIVFGLGRGGRAYYGLDVTTKAAPRFLWKVTNGTGGFTELGYTTSEASFSKASGNDVAIVGAGYDTYFDDSASTSANGSGMGRGIFVINLTTGALVSLIQPTGMDFAIPSNVAVADLNGDGVLDRAYVGDLGGQMWRITGALAATRLFCADATCPTTGTNPGKRRIFYAPDIVRDRGFLSVFFGTGDRSNPLRTDVVDRMYGVRDDGTSNLDEGDLIDVTTRVEENGSDEEAELIEELGDTNGWLIRLADRAGEKVLASPAAFFSVFFTTFTPINGVCNAGGDARLYELNYATGGIPDTNADGGETAADRVTDLGRSIPTELTIAILKESQAGSGGSVASSGAVGYVASSGEVDTVELPGIPNNVTPLSWRECSTVVPCLTP